MKLLQNRKFFTWWVSVGVPPFFLALALIPFRASLLFGLFNLLLMAAWTLETFSTTCRRCSFYGTSHCTLPGAVVPKLFSKKPASSISLTRVRIHFYFDLAMILYVNLVYALLFPILFPPVYLGSVVTLYFVFYKKQFHGLLHRLRQNPLTLPTPQPRSPKSTLSLPILRSTK